MKIKVSTEAGGVSTDTKDRRRLRAMSPSLKVNERMVREWNQAHPQLWVPVEVTMDDGSVLRTRTTSAACLLGGHTAVILVEGISGAYALARVKPAPAIHERTTEAQHNKYPRGRFA